MPSRRATVLVTIALCAVAIVLVGVGAVVEGPLPGDRWTLERLHDALGTTIDEPMRAIGDATDTWVLVLLATVAAAVLLWRRRVLDTVTFAVAFGVVIVVNPLLKSLVGRSRPDVRRLPESVSDLSFPSGHAAGTAALLGALLLVVAPRRARVLLAVAGGAVLALVAFSRLALSVHHPSDLLAGWCWATAWVAVIGVARTTAGRNVRLRIGRRTI